MSPEELAEIKTYHTGDIQHDLPALVSLFGMEDETVKAFIAELESRGVKPQLTERKKDKWYDFSVFPPNVEDNQQYVYNVGYTDKWHIPLYSDMINGERWNWRWTRNRQGEVVIHLWFLEIDESDYHYFDI